ncbi:lytic murein transglycosylase [Rhizobium sp. L1K21]|uniref:lytic murein transglycosylase n=1 Tax=Rhizobium sp. L1K21 TaxID=2954933 RepID=UPI0020927176|nr:lytic murein transglycosylase [Rhizobium sp. L1K21]MCO6185030.1 lytic murein transglycosylase [Rhizobium sp. L1K21]
MTARCAALCAALLLGAGTANADSGFVNWIQNFYPVAAKAGISRTTYVNAFEGITEPDPDVIRKAQYQPEFTTTIWDYLDSRVNPYTIQTGLDIAARNLNTLKAIETHFGVSRYVLLAIWSMESNYGAVLASSERLHYVPRALATLAYADPKRANFARSQLIATLKILQAGDVSRANLTGSWAGAMGHTQFIPTSYLLYGTDADGNGKRDIWNSIPDALATAANLLHKNGWREGRTWGYEVAVPRGGAKYSGQTKTLSQWEALGFKRPNGRDLRLDNERAVLKLPAGENGPGFLMTRNYFVIKKYNQSDSYALAVGLLADRLSGYPGMVQKWPRPAGALDVEEKFEIQERLKALGYYQGEVDGNLGSGSKAAIAAFQKRKGLKVDSEPSKALLEHLR